MHNTSKQCPILCQVERMLHPTHRITTDGTLHALANTQHSQLVILSLLGCFILSHGSLFGRFGLLGVANSLFGWLHIGAGQLIGVCHPDCCPLCEQELETIHHILSGCFFSRYVWSLLFHRYDLLDFHLSLQKKSSTAGG